MKSLVFAAALVGGMVPTLAYAQHEGPATGSTPVAPAAAPAPSGGTTPADTGAPAAPAAAPAATPAPLPFAGSNMLALLSMHTSVLFPDQMQYWNPTVDSMLWIRPRLSLGRLFQVRSDIRFFYEFTNSDSTTTMNEPRFGDWNVDLMFRGIPEFAGIKAVIGARVVIPTSPESRARTMYFGLGAVASLARSFRHVLGGELSFAATAFYTHPFYEYTTAGLRNPPAYAPQCFAAAGGDSCFSQVSGRANTENALSWLVAVDWDWGWITPNVAFLMGHSWGYRFRDLDGVARIDDPQITRQTTYFAAGLDFGVASWLTLGLSYSMSRDSILNGRSEYSSVFWDRYQDTRINASAFIAFDKLYTALSGRSQTPGHARVRPNRFLGL